jgi:hypothetical protein
MISKCKEHLTMKTLKSRYDRDRQIKNEIWTVDFFHRQFGDRDFTMQSSHYNENPDFAICEIPTESEPSDQHAI